MKDIVISIFVDSPEMIEHEECIDIIENVCNYFNVNNTIRFGSLINEDLSNTGFNSMNDLLGVYYSEGDMLRVRLDLGKYNKNVLLHELAHMVQSKVYGDDFDKPHGYYFQLAKKRMETWHKRRYGRTIKIR
jgi:hypothetical protein